MKHFFLFLFLAATLVVKAQTDTIPKDIHVSGTVGVTNNGISIIPTFSLRAPALVTTVSFSKNDKFSIDPDVRLTFDGRKGGAILWFRYKLLNQTHFKFNLGAHPAYNFALRTITENGKSWQVTQARRFWATEIAPTYVVNNHLAFGVYYLNGHGLQDDGPINTHFVTFNTALNNIAIGGNYLLNLNPNIYYLKVDKEDGYYLSGSTSIVNKQSPLSLVASYNKEIHTNITGSRDFDWNISIVYRFNNRYKLVR